MKDAIVFKNVHKYFMLQHQRTLKELFHALVKKDRTMQRVHAINNLSFTIQKGESVGIIGQNGAGKSTILKLIAGVSQQTKGDVKVHGRIAPLIELGAGFHPDLSGRENIFLNGVILGLTEDQVRNRFDDIVAFSGLEKKFIQMPVKHYSSGMYMRLAFSIAIHTDPEIMLVDEILAVGDASFQKKCIAKMNEFKDKDITLVFIAHNFELIKMFCERVMYIRKGKLVVDGKPRQAFQAYYKDSPYEKNHA